MQVSVLRLKTDHLQLEVAPFSLSPMKIISAATWWPLLVGAIGLFVGSYLNVVALRWFKPKSKSPQKLSNRSECPNCQRQLSFLEMLPIVSFLVLRRRCKNCQVAISWRYPLVESVTGLVFLFLALNFSNLTQLIVLTCLASIMIVIALIDLETQLIPDKLTLPSIAVFALLIALFQRNNFLDFLSSGLAFDHWLIGILIGVAIPGLIVVLTKGKGMGIGDIKLGGLIGLSLGGVYGLLALFLAFVIGAIVGLGLIAKNQANLKTALPFGPFMVAGWFLTLFFGPQIVAWYTNLAYL